MVLEHLQQMDPVNQQSWNYNKPFTRVNTSLELQRSLKLKAFKFQFHPLPKKKSFSFTVTKTARPLHTHVFATEKFPVFSVPLVASLSQVAPSLSLSVISLRLSASPSLETMS